MPTFDFKCKEGHVITHMIPNGVRWPNKCTCGEPVTRVYSPFTFRVK